MSKGIVRIRISKNAIEKLFGSGKIGVSKGIDKVLEKYSEKLRRMY
jgi:hypothetical protein